MPYWRNTLTGMTAALVMGAMSCAETPSATTSDEPIVQSVPALMTDDHQLYIDKPADLVWAEIKRRYVDGDRYAEYGNDIIQLTDDPKAFMGGYKAIAETEDGEKITNGVFRFSDIDDENMFLAMSIDTPDVKNIVVSHHIRPSGDGAVYHGIIHAFFPVTGSDGAAPTVAESAEQMDALLTDHHGGLVEIMETVKTEIEALP